MKNNIKFGLIMILSLLSIFFIIFYLFLVYEKIGLLTASILIILAVIIIMLIVYLYVSNKIFKPSKKIMNQVEKLNYLYPYSNNVNNKYADEVDYISKQLYTLECSINDEVKSRDEIVRALSHEFKTPLAKISSILFLYENKVEDYQDFTYVKKQVDQIIDNNSKLITAILKSLNSNINTNNQPIDLKEMVEEKIKGYQSLLDEVYVQTNIDDLKVNKNHIAIDFLISNILSNMAKYSETYILIEQKGNSLYFENDYKKKPTEGTGSKIINTMSKIEKIGLDKKIEKNNYKIILKF